MYIDDILYQAIYTKPILPVTYIIPNIHQLILGYLLTSTFISVAPSLKCLLSCELLAKCALACRLQVISYSVLTK